MSEQSVVDEQENGTDHSGDATRTKSADEIVESLSEQESKPTLRQRIVDRASGRAVSTGLAALVVALAVATGVLAVLLAGERSDASQVRAAAEHDAKAQQVALDYAVGAARLDYHDLPGWNRNLVAGTSPELKEKLTTAATSMEQVVVPLQWTSTAQPITAQVTGHNGDLYTVAAFVNVTTKNAQSKDGVQSTATYTVTLDQSKDWLITDVGGFNPIGQK